MSNIIAVEFLDSLHELTSAALRNYLKANGAPNQTTEAVNDLVDLAHYAKEIRLGKLTESDYQTIVDSIPGIVNRIAELGGVFPGCETTSIPREAVKWESDINLRV